MKMQWKRLGSGLLAAGFLISTLGIGAMAAQSPVEKDETVYAIAGADGSVTETIVSDWLKKYEPRGCPEGQLQSARYRSRQG